MSHGEIDQLLTTLLFRLPLSLRPGLLQLVAGTLSDPGWNLESYQIPAGTWLGHCQPWLKYYKTGREQALIAALNSACRGCD